jgi:hypothetical protein
LHEVFQKTKDELIGKPLQLYVRSLLTRSVNEPALQDSPIMEFAVRILIVFALHNLLHQLYLLNIYRVSTSHSVALASALFIKYLSVFTPRTLLHQLYLSNIYSVRTSHSVALALFNHLFCLFAQGPKSELFIQNVDHWKHPPANGPNFFKSDGKYEKDSIQDEFLTTLRKLHFIFSI